MSTPNFTKTNASVYFVSACEEDWDYDCLVDNIQSEIIKIGGRLTEKYNGDRSYPAKIIAQIEKQIRSWTITADVIVRSGYYSGVNLDWDVHVYNENTGDEWDYEYIDNSIPAYIKDAIDRITAKIEKIFKQNTDRYIRTAIFSNGEAIYEKIK